MLKEDFIKLGIPEEQAEKASEASKKELEEYVEKTMFDEIKQTQIKLENDIKQRDEQLEILNKSTGDSKQLKEQITKLQMENKAKDEEYKENIKNLKISTAINASIVDKAQDMNLIETLFDKSKLTLNEDGKVNGVEEQLNELQKTKPFLFKTGKTKTVYEPKDGETSKSSLAQTIAEQMNSENLDNPYAKAWEQK